MTYRSADHVLFFFFFMYAFIFRRKYYPILLSADFHKNVYYYVRRIEPRFLTRQLIAMYILRQTTICR